jgi:hypothetical protein
MTATLATRLDAFRSRRWSQRMGEVFDLIGRIADKLPREPLDGCVWTRWLEHVHALYYFDVPLGIRVLNELAHADGRPGWVIRQVLAFRRREHFRFAS